MAAVTYPEASPKSDKEETEMFKRISEPQSSTRVKTNNKDSKRKSIHVANQPRKVQGQVVIYPEPAAQEDDKDNNRSTENSSTSVIARMNTERKVTVDKVVVIHLKIPQRRRQSSGLLFEKECRELLLYLDKLSQSSKDDYRELKQQTGKMLERYTERQKWDYMILIYTKLIGAAHYRDDIKSAKKYMKEVGCLLKKCIRDRALLTGRALVYQTAIYREKLKFAKAENAALQALSVLQDVDPGEDTAKAHYNYGKYFMKRLETVNTGTIEEFQNRALEQFTLAMDHYKRAQQIDVVQVNRCLLNMARVCINCPLTRVKQHAISDEREMQKKLVMEGPLNSRSTEEAKIFMETLKGFSAMKDMEEKSKRNHMQILYTEAEIMFIDALFILNDDSNKNDPFFEKISHTMLKLKEACAIASSGGYKESTSASKFHELLENIHGKFKARVPKNTHKTDETKKAQNKSGSNADIKEVSLVNASGPEDLSSNTESANSDRLC